MQFTVSNAPAPSPGGKGQAKKGRARRKSSLGPGRNRKSARTILGAVTSLSCRSPSVVTQVDGNQATVHEPERWREMIGAEVVGPLLDSARLVIVSFNVAVFDGGLAALDCHLADGIANLDRARIAGVRSRLTRPGFAPAQA